MKRSAVALLIVCLMMTLLCSCNKTDNTDPSSSSSDTSTVSETVSDTVSSDPYEIQDDDSDTVVSSGTQSRISSKKTVSSNQTIPSSVASTVSVPVSSEIAHLPVISSPIETEEIPD